jgi:hypothetical protein
MLLQAGDVPADVLAQTCAFLRPAHDIMFRRISVPAAKRRRLGCSGIFSFLFLAALVFVFYNWPSFIDAKGAGGTASITEKRETVREHFGDWFRQFQIVAAFRAPGSPFERHAICDVEQRTYDSLHPGDPVTVHYFPALLQQPFIPATHLAPCTQAANFGSNPDLYRRIELVFGSLFAILFAWLVLRIRIAGWLLVPWFGLFILYCVTPRAEPAPNQPRPANARVRSVSTIDEILVGGLGHEARSEPMKLAHPYQLVQLEFTPAHATGPVVALDTVDLNSIPGLALKQIVDIDYDAANPRIARIHGGTRNFPQQALHQLMLTYGIVAGLFLLLFIFTGFLRLLRPKSSPHRSAQMNLLRTLLQRRF